MRLVRGEGGSARKKKTLFHCFSPWRTSGSSFSQLSRTCSCPSCTCGRSPAPMGHRDLGPSGVNRSRATPDSAYIHLKIIDETYQRNTSMFWYQITTLEIVRAGLHCSFKMSRQMLPLLLIFGWKTLVRKATYTKTIHVSETHVQAVITIAG